MTPSQNSQFTEVTSPELEEVVCKCRGETDSNISEAKIGYFVHRDS